MNAPSADEPNLQVATVVEIGEVMKDWKNEPGSGTWTGTENRATHDLPPLRLTEPPDRADRLEQTG